MHIWDVLRSYFGEPKNTKSSIFFFIKFEKLWKILSQKNKNISYAQKSAQQPEPSKQQHEVRVHVHVNVTVTVAPSVGHNSYIQHQLNLNAYSFVEDFPLYSHFIC